MGGLCQKAYGQVRTSGSHARVSRNLWGRNPGIAVPTASGPHMQRHRKHVLSCLHVCASVQLLRQMALAASSPPIRTVHAPGPRMGPPTCGVTGASNCVLHGI